MREFVYTILDDFDILHYGNIDAKSADDAGKKIQEEYGSDIPFEIWHSSKTLSKKNLFGLHLTDIGYEKVI